MPLNPQPDFPSPLVQDLVGSIPMFNTSMGLSPMFHQPYLPQSSGYAVPPPPMHGGPSPFSDIFSGGRYMQNPGAVGFQQAQGIPFFQGTSLMSMGMNAIANQGLQLLGGSLPGGEALGKGMIPFGGLQTSRMNYIMMRERQDIMDQMFKGMTSENLASKNPDLGFFGTMGMASNPFVQMAVGGLTGFKTRMEAYSGNLGRAFGGSISDQLRGGALAGMAFEHAITQNGGGVDWNLTQGMGRDQFQSALTTAVRRGAFVSGGDLRDIAQATADDPEKGRRLAAKTAGGLSQVMALGRDVFGQNATEDDIISGIENVFGREGMTDSGQAAQRLRELEAAGQVLNMDSQVVAKYMQVMKQIARNAGLVGEAGTNASLGMIMSGESAARFGNDKNINVDKNAIVSGTTVSMERNLNSSDAKQKEALLNTLRTSQKDVLADISLGKIGGKEMSALQFLNYVEKEMADPNITYERRRELEGNMESAIKAVNSSKSGSGRMIADRFRQLAALPQDELVNTFNELRGKTGYKEFTMGSGYNRAQMDAYEKALERGGELIKGGTVKGGSALVKKYGGLKGLMDKVQDTGFFTALQSGDTQAAEDNLRKEFKDLNGEQFDSLMATIQTVMGESKRYSNETFDETKSNFAAMERAKKAGSLMPEFRDRERTLDVFTRIAGGLPTGGNLKARGIEAIMRAVNEEGGLTKKKLAAIIGEATGSDRVSAFSEIISGKVTSKVGGKDLTFRDLMGQVRGVLGDNSLSKDERDKKAEDMTRDFWKNISGAKLSSGKTVGEVMKDSRDTVDATGKGGGGTTASKDEVALGSNLLKAFDQMRGDSNERLDKVVDALKGVAKLLTPGSPKAKGPEE